MVLTTAHDGHVRLISAVTGAEIATLEGYSGKIGKVSFDGNTRFLLMDFGDNTGLWDVATGKLLHQFKGSYDRIVLSPDGRFALTATTGRVELWNTKSGELLGILLHAFKP